MAKGLFGIMGRTKATTKKPGAVKQAASIADLTGAPTQADFNGLLAKLRAAGVLAP